MAYEVVVVGGGIGGLTCAALLAARGLPTSLDPAVDHAAVMTAMQGDKKRRAGRVGFVLVEAPGDVRTGIAVSPDDLRAAVAELERS